jgi:E3 ubiquitin-protein ligase SHPRH
MRMPAGAAAAATARDTPALIAALADHDVVLTTYRALDAEAAGRAGGRAVPRVLSRIAWRRVCLDECQEVRSNTTTLARTAAGLTATHRWMISGTPLYSSVDDLNGALRCCVHFLLSAWC